MIYLTIPITLFIPIIPWVALFSWEVGRRFDRTKLIVLFVSGIIFDLWWGKPLGATVVVLIGLSLLIYLGKRVWPADNRIFLTISLIAAFTIMELFLRL